MPWEHSIHSFSKAWQRAAALLGCSPLCSSSQRSRLMPSRVCRSTNGMMLIKEEWEETQINDWQNSLTPSIGIVLFESHHPQNTSSRLILGLFVFKTKLDKNPRWHEINHIMGSTKGYCHCETPAFKTAVVCKRDRMIKFEPVTDEALTAAAFPNRTMVKAFSRKTHLHLSAHKT